MNADQLKGKWSHWQFAFERLVARAQFPPQCRPPRLGSHGEGFVDFDWASVKLPTVDSFKLSDVDQSTCCLIG